MSSLPARETVVIACHPKIRNRLDLRAGASTVRFVDLGEGCDAWDLPSDVDVLITRTSDWDKAPSIPAETWAKGLNWVHALSAGIDGYPSWIFDVPEATCGRGSSSVAIAEYVMAAILHHEKHLSDILVNDAAKWQQIRMGGLAGKTIGLFGLGAIGLEIARRALAFDMQVVAFRRTPQPSPLDGIRMVTSVEELVGDCDHLVLAAPLTPETRHVINADVLSKASKGMHLINVSRGALINDDDMLQAIEQGVLSAVTLDVTNPEPLPAGHIFYTHPQVRLTPHISWYAEDGDRRMSAGIQANLDRYIRRQPLLNTVDNRKGY